MAIDGDENSGTYPLLHQKATPGRAWLPTVRVGAPPRGTTRRSLPRLPLPRVRSLHTILSGTIFEKTRQPPARLVLMLRGIAKGESTARLAREFAVSRKQMHTIRHRVHENLSQTLPTRVREDEVEFEADALYQNSGEKSEPLPARRARRAQGVSRHLRHGLGNHDECESHQRGNHSAYVLRQYRSAR